MHAEPPAPARPARSAADSRKAARRRRRKRGWSRLYTGIAASVLAGIMRAVGATLRVRHHGGDPETLLAHHRVAACWHRSFLVGACVFRDRGFAVPVSRSRDGDFAVDVMTRLGWARPPRGSSNRAARTVLRELVRAVKEGQPVILLSDGPLGPARRSKPGIVGLARMTGEAIVPVALSARPSFRLGSWDRTIVALPFARVAMFYGEPIRVPPASAGDGDITEKVRQELDCALNELADAADRALGLEPD